MKTLGVLANCRKPEACVALNRLAQYAKKLGLDLVVFEETGQLLPCARRIPAGELPSQVDALLALGGDGTLLRGARALAGSDVPVLGVNLGSLGFLTSVTEDDLERALDGLVQGHYTTSVRTVAECRLLRDHRLLGEYRALNDVVVGWGASSRIITLGLLMDGDPVASYHCDGLIVATPTGSTAHALSADGPILHPDCPCFVICAICPHTLSHRPLVVPDQRTLTVEVTLTVKDLLLSVDGQEEQAVKQGDRLEIRRSDRGLRLLHLPDYSYFSVLRQKLNWRGSTRKGGGSLF